MHERVDDRVFLINLFSSSFKLELRVSGTWKRPLKWLSTLTTHWKHKKNLKATQMRVAPGEIVISLV